MTHQSVDLLRLLCEVRSDDRTDITVHVGYAPYVCYCGDTGDDPVANPVVGVTEEGTDLLQQLDDQMFLYELNGEEGVEGLQTFSDDKLLRVVQSLAIEN